MIPAILDSVKGLIEVLKPSASWRAGRLRLKAERKRQRARKILARDGNVDRAWRLVEDANGLDQLAEEICPH